MTIASEITRINTNIENAYTACNGKGATMPVTQNSANLANCISSIPAGSTAGQTRTVENGVYTMPTNNFTFVMPSNATDIGDNALADTFNWCSGVIGADFSSLITLSGENALLECFRNCRNLTSVDFSNLTTISGLETLLNAFLGCSGLINLDFSSLVTISGDSALYSTFWGCSGLTSVDFSSLTTVSGGWALETAFLECASLTNIEFTSLTNLTGSGVLMSAFYDCSSLATLSFPALTSTSFGLYNDQFTDMLSNVENCTVHFPSNLQSVIGSWFDVTTGFGGTNTTVLFDLPATT